MTMSRANSRWSGGQIGAALLVLLLCVVPAFASGGNAPQKRDLKAEVERLEGEWRTAQLAGDTAAMDRMLAEDYVGMTMQGQVTTKTQQLRRMQERRMVVRRLDLSDVKVRLTGEIAVVTMRARVMGTSTAGAIDGRFRCRQVFHLLPSGRWAMTNFEADPMNHRDHGQVRAG